MNFVEFPKIPRLSRNCTITEKIDGTNGCVSVRHGEPWLDGEGIRRFPTDHFEFGLDTQVGDLFVRAGSRTRWLGHSKAEDHYGFGAWVMQHAHELAKLGPGNHFGEWWGLGIQRGYGQDRKRFSLFNTSRWAPFSTSAPIVVEDKTIGTTITFCGELKEGQAWAPGCCDVVPVLYEGLFETARVEQALHLLGFGSVAARGWLGRPEGVIVFHHASNSYFKKTLEKDAEWKGRQ